MLAMVVGGKYVERQFKGKSQLNRMAGRSELCWVSLPTKNRAKEANLGTYSIWPLHSIGNVAVSKKFADWNNEICLQRIIKMFCRVKHTWELQCSRLVGLQFMNNDVWVSTFHTWNWMRCLLPSLQLPMNDLNQSTDWRTFKSHVCNLHKSRYTVAIIIHLQ